MRTVLYLFLLLTGLSGCVTRTYGSKEHLYAYKDSMTYVQLDTSCLHYNRHTRLRGRLRLKEVSFSSPDSVGKQHVERVVCATEEWGVADSTEVFAMRTVTTERQDTNTVLSAEKVITKQEPRRVVSYLVFLLLLGFFVVFIFFCLWIVEKCYD